MKTVEQVEIITCDFCGERAGGSSTTVTIDGKTYDICKHCAERLNIVVGWKTYKDDYASLNMNQSVTVRFGKDAADAYNAYYAPYTSTNVKEGEWKTLQLHNFLQACSKAFEKCCGSYQGIAYPFELRMKLSDLSFETKESCQNKR